MDPLEERAKTVSADGVRGDRPPSDITEHQRAEEALRASESRYRLLFENHVAAIICNTLDGRIVECNDAAARILGYESPQEMLGLNMRDIHCDPAKRVDLIARLQAGKTRDEIEAKLWRKNGTPVWVIANISLTRIDRTGETFIQGTMIDITERKIMEESLRESEERFRELVESTEVIVWEAIAATLRITFVSQGAEKILGYPRDQWLQTPGFWADHLHPEDRPEALACEREVTEKGKPRSVEYRMKAADGRILWFRDLMHAVSGPGGKVERLRGIMVDITESKRAEDALRESEERYRKLFEVESDAILVADVDTGRILDANAAALNLYGFSRGELLSVTVEEVSAEPDKTRAALTQEWEHVQLRWHRKKDGTVFPVEISGGYFLTYGRRVHVAAIRDITERRRAEEALRESDLRYRDFIEHSSEGVRRLEFEQPIPINLANEEVLKRILQYGYLAECNAAHAHHLGFATAEDLVGKRVGELLAASDEERVASLQTSARPGYQSQTFEVRRRDKTGAFRHLLRTEIPIVQNGMLMRVWGITRDITELRQAENALRESEERFRSTFENAGMGMALVDMQGHLFKSNLALRQMLGYSEEELSGMAFTEFTHPEDRDLEWRLFRELVEGKRDTYEMEKRYLKKDGGVVWGLLTVSLVKGMDGGSLYGVGIVQDITERKRAEDALRRSEANLREALLAAQMGIWEWTVATDTVTWDDNMYRIAGQDSNLFAPGSREQPLMYTPGSWAQLKAAAENTLATGTPYQLDLELARPDGSKRWVIGRGEPVRDASGHITQLRGTVQDITQRKRSEDELRESEAGLAAAQRIAHIGSWHWDVQTDTARWSDETFRIFGLTPRQLEEHRKSFLDMIHPEDKARVDRALMEAVNGTGKYDLDYLIQLPDGTVKMIHAQAETLNDEAGRPLRMQGTIQDITERKRMEKDLQSSLDQLRALAARLQSIREEERTRVARDIHDQLGQALTAIKLDMSSLVRELPAGVAQQSKRASSILQLVDESIQAVRRISTELRPGILDDLGLVAAIEWAGEDFQARTGTTCGLDLPQEVIAVDPEQATAIFRIFQETMTNVARHAHASKVEVRLAREDGDLTLEVHDDGKGMPEDKLMNIESLGILGMRGRAMLLGGELTISSPPGKGTTVRVRIPEAHRT